MIWLFSIGVLRGMCQQVWILFVIIQAVKPT